VRPIRSKLCAICCSKRSWQWASWRTVEVPRRACKSAFGIRRIWPRPTRCSSVDRIRARLAPIHYLGRYVRELGVLTLEDCIRRMTSGPAECFRLADRGLIRSRMAADLVLFDPTTIADRATYESPMQYPEGVEMVVVNGEVVVEHDQHLEVTPGRSLRLDG
jgi:N-acyl-D-aspartate/D-glutamate deacylase